MTGFKFKPGDRVRVSRSFYKGPHLGEILTVKEARATYLYLTKYPRSGWAVSHFELVDRPVQPDYWDESKHHAWTTRMINGTHGQADGHAALAVLLLINIVQHLQPRWVERPPETVTVVLPREMVQYIADGYWGAPLMRNAATRCRAALETEETNHE